MHPSRWGEKRVTPANARTPIQPGMSNWITQTLSYGKSLELPFVGQPTDDTYIGSCPSSGRRQITRISCQYCATQRGFRAQRRMAGPRQTLVPAEEHPKINLRKFQDQVSACQVFGLAAS